MIDETHPLANGVGTELFMYYRSTLPVMRSFQHRIVGFFPDASSPDFYCNGFQEGSDVALSGSTAVHQRVVEAGLVTSFAYEINFVSILLIGVIIACRWSILDLSEIQRSTLGMTGSVSVQRCLPLIWMSATAMHA
jgi:hypothetical protein